ncbi:MAG: hypothetical protein ACYDG5_03695 [Dehalococcoidales bacterium]
MARRRETKELTPEATLEKKKAILAALAKASEDNLFPKESPDTPNCELQEYYTLSPNEMAALVSGDLETIEIWISNLDKNHATRLLRWLIKESW